jgi:hypothetical protein
LVFTIKSVASVVPMKFVPAVVPLFPVSDQPDDPDGNVTIHVGSVGPLGQSTGFVTTGLSVSPGLMSAEAIVA